MCLFFFFFFFFEIGNYILEIHTSQNYIRVLFENVAAVDVAANVDDTVALVVVAYFYVVVLAVDETVFILFINFVPMIISVNEIGSIAVIAFLNPFF